MNSEKIKSLARSVAIGIFGALTLLFVFSGSTRATVEGFSWEKVEEKIAELVAEKLMGSIPTEGVFGASGTRFPNGISADSTSPSAGQLRGTKLNITSTSTLGDLSSVVVDGTFADATTTVFCSLNPYSVTSTVDLAYLEVTTPATSTVSYTVATSTTAFPISLSGASLISSAEVVTGTLATILNGGTDPNPGAVSRNQISVGPSQYVCGLITGNSVFNTLSVTSPENTLTGRWSLRFNQF